MTEKEFRDRIDAMIEAEYKALGVDIDDPGFQPTPEQHDLVVERYGAQVAIELERDPLFRQAWFLDVATQHMREWETDHRPTGAYREDGFLPLSDRLRVFMRDATREHLLSWALQENDEHNLAYIKSRLDHWEKHPSCKTLGELEATITKA
jgi:hypothetical protein